MSRPGFELNESFYKEYEQAAARLAEVEEDLVLHTDGLDALEKQLMKEHDAEHMKQYKKSAPEYWQRREAKSDSRYHQMIYAKAALVSRKIMLKAQINMLDMRYQEWRTRSANRRTGLS